MKENCGAMELRGRRKKKKMGVEMERIEQQGVNNFLTAMSGFQQLGKTKACSKCVCRVRCGLHGCKMDQI